MKLFLFNNISLQNLNWWFNYSLYKPSQMIKELEDIGFKAEIVHYDECPSLDMCAEDMLILDGEWFSAIMTDEIMYNEIVSNETFSTHVRFNQDLVSILQKYSNPENMSFRVVEYRDGSLDDYTCMFDITTSGKERLIAFKKPYMIL